MRRTFITAISAAVAGFGATRLRVSDRRPNRTVHRRVVGLDSEVEILRDRLGVPAIYAANELDVYFGQGFAHGQDRLFQMDMQRRVALGTVSELAGSRALGMDRTHRTIGLNRLAQRDLEDLDGATRDTLDAYAAGVNSAIGCTRRPLEYRALRARPTPWSALDSLAVAKLMQWELGCAWHRILLREQITDAVGESASRALFADDTSATAQPRAPRPPTTSRDDEHAGADSWPFLGVDSPDSLGSNAWAVSGGRTASGRPIIANDLHLPLTVPGLAYQIALHAPDQDCAGVSIPGAPGVLTGHNQHIAWGVATVHARVQDVYVEPRRDADFRVIRERIKVKGGEAVDLDVMVNNRGPVISGPDFADDPDRSLTLRWQAMEHSSSLIRAILDVNRSHDWASFRTALRSWDEPTLKFVYADTTGTVAHQIAGRVPVRRCGATSMPLDASDPLSDWTGVIPFDDLPHGEDGDIIVAANARPDLRADIFLAPEWCASNRERRIAERLRAKRDHTIESMHDIQMDTVSVFGARLAKVLAQESDGTTAVERRVRELLGAWDGRMDRDSSAAGICAVAARSLAGQLVRTVLHDDTLVDKYLTREQQYTEFVDRLLDDPESSWWRQGGCSRQRHINAALTTASDWWTSRHGNDLDEWRWGRAHATTIRHPIFGGIPGIARFANVVIPAVPGDAQSPFSTGFFDQYETVAGPVQRQVIDTSDWSRHAQAVSFGQSGHVFHRHYRDQVSSWTDGGLSTLNWDREDVDRAAVARLRLIPAGRDG